MKVKTFYLYESSRSYSMTRQHMDHASCIELACYMSPSKLAKDIEEWRDSAKHGDTFELDSNRKLVCLFM